MSEYGADGRVGILVPPANPTVEPEMFRLLPQTASVHVQRLPVLADLALRDRLTGYNDRLEEAVAGFGGMDTDAVYYACTGASYLVGPAGDAELAERISQASGAIGITAANAIVRCLKAYGLERIGLLSPYPTWLTDLATGFWEASGLNVVSVAPVPTGSGGIYGLTTSTVRPVAERMAAAGLDALLLSGTGMPTVRAATEVGGSTGLPVMSSAIAAAWAVTEVLRDRVSESASWAQDLAGIMQPLESRLAASS